MIIDANNAIVGRVAAVAAKNALRGEDVIILNAEKAVISGDPLVTVKKYYGRRQMTQKANPENAAKWPRREDLMFKRIIRGMLPKHSPRGKAAEAKIRVFLGVPKEYEGKGTLFDDTAEKLSGKYITMADLIKKI